MMSLMVEMLLKRGRLLTAYSYSLNKERIIRKSNWYMKQTLELIANNGELPKKMKDLPYAEKFSQL